MEEKQMDSEKLLELILDVGTELIRSGGETHRVEDTMYRIADSYGFRKCNFWVVPSNIQSTVITPEGRTLTQMRHVHNAGIDFDRLDKLNALSRWACAEHPEEGDFEQRLSEIRQMQPQRAWLHYLAGVLSGWGFALFFGCDLLDSATAALAALIITFLVRRLSGREGNPLILNFVISFVTETFIILAVHFGLGSHVGGITIGVVMLLISGLGTTNGLRDLVHLDTISGVMNISVSLTGAIGIALGIALPLFGFRGWGGGSENLSPTVAIQLLSATVGSVGFALWFHVNWRRIGYCALGAILTWAVYLLFFHFVPDTFGAALISAVFCGFYAQIMARINKTPATIFSTVCIFPLIPGASLYYMMHGFVTKDIRLAYDKGAELALTCFGIVLGFMVVEVITRFLWRRPHEKQRNADPQ